MRVETFTTPEPPGLRINVPAGAITIHTSEAAETRVELSGPHEDEARIELRRDEIVVEVERKKVFGSSRDHRLDIIAPLGARVDAQTASADVEGRGRFGQVSVDSASGDVSFEHVEGRFDVNTASGDIRVDFVGDDVRVNSASGDVWVGEAEHDMRVRTASGDVEVRSAVRGKVDVQSASGDVSVGIRRGSKVYIDASSMSGDTTSELELSDTPPHSEGPSVDFRARTMSGDITVRRAS
jgi:DUF4097 and DUF4098 domain-containing protein YvlB